MTQKNCKMEKIQEINPAEQASVECINRVYDAIDKNQSFRVEAGAGAGKTYTLVKALKHLIKKHEREFIKNHKRIACITYTNVAKDEIRSRVDNHPIIVADTIHAFAWEVIQGFQQPLRDRMGELDGKWKERIKEAGGVNKQKVKYDLGYPKITADEIYLHHNDLIKLFASLIRDEKFRRIFSSKYPVVLIDEYQDTNKGLADAIVETFIQTQQGSRIGLFGDHWQKIYGSEACGLIEADADKLIAIGKEANFRSDKNIVAVLNRMRPELPQQEYDPNSEGEVIVYHTNNWKGTRRPPGPGGHWGGDLPPQEAHDFLQTTKGRLNNIGWDISPDNTKILMLTNNVLASEQGYQTISSNFSDNDDYLKLNDPYIDFLVTTVEVGAEAFRTFRYGAMLEAFGLRTAKIRTQADKVAWQDSMARLEDSRNNGTVGNLIDLLKVTHRPRLSPKLEEKEERFKEISKLAVADREADDIKFFDKTSRIRSIPYKEIPNLAAYINDKTLYSTKHGVKGAEFENVIVVLGRGWNHYNWSAFLEKINQRCVDEADRDTFERNRNLFYVACSRARKRLCLLFTQELSSNAMQGLEKLFGNSSINSA
jgi:DNA helicase-2/ATP-dependent DNA helicase PcrA